MIPYFPWGAAAAAAVVVVVVVIAVVVVDDVVIDAAACIVVVVAALVAIAGDGEAGECKFTIARWIPIPNNSSTSFNGASGEMV